MSFYDVTIKLRSAIAVNGIPIVRHILPSLMNNLDSIMII